MAIRHIRTKLALASMAVMAPFILWTGLVQYARYNESCLDVVDGERQVARSAAFACLDAVKDMVDVARVSGEALLSDRSHSHAELMAHLEWAIASSSRIGSIAVADTQGRLMAATGPTRFESRLTGLRCARETLQGRSWAVETISSRPANSRVICVAAAIRDPAGRQRGIVVACSEVGRLRGWLPSKVVAGHRILVIDSVGEPVLAPPEDLSAQPENWRASRLRTSALARRPIAGDSVRLPGGSLMVGALEPIPETGWAIGSFVPRDKTMSPLRQSALLRFALSMLATLFAAAAAYALGDRIAAPVMSLARAARGLSQGDFSVRARVSGQDEVGLLATSFNEMAEALQEKTEELNYALSSETRARQKISALNAVAQGIVATIDLRDRLEVIAKSLAGIVGATRCSIFLCRGGRLTAGGGWGLLFPESFSDRLADDMLRSGMVPGDLGDLKRARFYDVEANPLIDRAFTAKYKVGAYILLPIAGWTRIVGIAILDRPGERHAFSDEVVADAQGLSEMAAIAIEISESYERERNIAQSLQRSMLPDIPARVGRFSIASGYYAAMDVADLGGDFYDFMNLRDGRLGLLIADVSGKGLEAAVYTAMGKYTLRAFATESLDPGVVLTRANAALAPSEGEWGFVTMFFAMLDLETSSITYSCAGHPPALLIDQSGSVRYLPEASHRPPVGILEGVEFPSMECPISPGSVLVCYTDGVIDARRAGERFDIERLASLVTELRYLSPEGIVQSIHQAVSEYSGGRVQDDIALLVVKHDAV